MGKLYYLLICVMLLGCTTKPKIQSEYHIDVPLNVDIENAPDFSTSDLKLEYKIIPLDIHADYLIGEYSKVVVEDSVIIVVSMQDKKVFVFDQQGKGKFVIGPGRGPDELFFPTDVYYSVTDRTIEVLDFYQQIKKYDSRGKFIETIDLESGYANFTKVGNKYFLFNSNVSKEDPYFLTVWDGKEKKQYLERKIVGEIFIRSMPFLVKEKSVLVHPQYGDLLYEYDLETQDVYPVVHFQNVFSDKEKYFERWEEFVDYCKNKYIPHLSDVLIDDDQKIMTMGVLIEKYRTLIYDCEADKIYKYPFFNLPYVFAFDGFYNDLRIGLFPPYLLDEIDDKKLNPEEKRFYDDMIRLTEGKNCEDENMYMVAVKLFKE